MAHDGHVLGAVTLSDTGLVVAEGDVEGPVQAVLDGPVAAYGVGGLRGGEGARGDEVAGVEAGAILQLGA